MNEIPWDKIPTALRDYVLECLKKELQEIAYAEARSNAEMHIMVAGLAQGAADAMGDRGAKAMTASMSPMLTSIHAANEVRAKALIAAIRKLSES